MDEDKRGWVEFQLGGPVEALEVFADFMSELGAGGAVFSEDPERPGSEMVTAFIPLREATEGMVARIKARAATLSREFPGRWSPIKITRVEDRDWAGDWKEALEPVRLEPGIWIVPAFKEAPEEIKHEPVIFMEPGLAFGVGTHPSTRACVKVVAEAVKAGARSVLDLGTGTGILAMTAALLDARRILALDLDPMALKVAEENLARNRLRGRVVLAKGVADPETRLSGEPFQLIAANIFANTLVSLMPFIKRHMAIEGQAVLSGIMKESSHLVADAARERGLQIVSRIEEEEWVTLVLRPGGKGR